MFVSLSLSLLFFLLWTTSSYSYEFPLLLSVDSNGEITIPFVQSYYLANKIQYPENVTEFAEHFADFIQLVDYWTQVLGTVLAKSQFPQNRKNIVRNLYDENMAELSHVETFYHFLIECGYHKTTSITALLDSSYANPIILKYRKQLADFVATHDYNDCVEMLGGIEYMYQFLSKDINSLFVTKQPTYHFTLHEVLDKVHSRELLESSDHYPHNLSFENIEFGAKWIFEVVQALFIY